MRVSSWVIPVDRHLASGESVCHCRRERDLGECIRALHPRESTPQWRPSAKEIGISPVKQRERPADTESCPTSVGAASGALPTQVSPATSSPAAPRRMRGTLISAAHPPASAAGSLAVRSGALLGAGSAVPAPPAAEPQPPRRLVCSPQARRRSKVLRRSKSARWSRASCRLPTRCRRRDRQSRAGGLRGSFTTERKRTMDNPQA